MIKCVHFQNGVGYTLNDLDHNPSGPARVWYNGEWCWALHDKIHRYYGPCDSGGDWYVHGGKIK